MAISFRIERDMVLTDMGATPSLDEVLAYLAAATTAPGFHAGMPSLVDCRQLTTQLSAAELRAIADEIKQLTTSPVAGRCAVVAASDVVFGLSRMYEVYSEGAPVEVRTFRDWDRAVAWLTEGELHPPAG